MAGAYQVLAQIFCTVVKFGTYHSNSYLSLIEQGKRKPTAEIIFKVATLFQVGTDVLMNDALDLPDEE